MIFFIPQTKHPHLRVIDDQHFWTLPMRLPPKPYPFPVHIHESHIVEIVCSLGPLGTEKVMICLFADSVDPH
jgi:hypothetical protein